MTSVIELGGSTPAQKRADYIAALRVELAGYRARGDDEHVAQVVAEIRRAGALPDKAF